MPDFSHETLFLQNFTSKQTAVGEFLIAGVDEAGCGPWAGPVVAGAVVFRSFESVPQSLLDILDDSKKLTKKRREVAFEILKSDTKNAFCKIGVGIVSVEEIDKINIRNAAMRAMVRAVENLNQPLKGVLVDGIAKPNLPFPYQTIIKGDSKSFSIAAGSIIAKVTRDQMMDAVSKDFPEYGFDSHAGYGTKKHADALAIYGVTPHHRTSFAPIKKLLEKNQSKHSLKEAA